jgi:hypothetical protein
MQPRGVAAAISVINLPDIPADVPLKDENMVASNCSHPRRGSGARKAKPIRREIKRRNDPAEEVQTCSAAAVSRRTAGRSTTNHAARRNRNDTSTVMIPTRFSGQRQCNEHCGCNYESQHLTSRFWS